MSVLPCADVSRETSARLSTFVDELLRWNKRINLIARGDEPRVWERHVQDALQLLPLLPKTADRITDLGSGGGFPGLVLAITTDLPVTLIEADARKCAFLRAAALVTKAAVNVVNTRIEQARVPPAPLITARALAPLPRLLSLAAPLLCPDGVCLFLKGARLADELTEAAVQWQMDVMHHPSRTDPAGTILRIAALRRA